MLSWSIMTQISKLDSLLKSDQRLFHTQDLAILWGIGNRSSLYTAIKRLIKRGVLISITKGLYSTVPVEKIDKFELGTALIHRFCYVSCETVLEIEGAISQKIYPVTFVSSVSAKINYKDTQFIYRRLKPELLFDPEGVVKKDGYFIATKSRAIKDMMYLNPNYYIDDLDNSKV